MAKSSKFKCPQCLSDVVVSTELASTRVECPVCEAMLTVPLSLGHDALFDDLFDDGSTDNHDQEQQLSENESGIEELHEISDEATVDDSQSDTQHPVEVEIISSSEALQIDEVVPISEVATPSDIHVIEDVEPTEVIEDVVADMIDVGATDQGENVEADSSATDDPFAYDEDKAIHIEGVTDGLLAPDAFYLKCPVCDSHMKATERQIGDKIVCSDCHSEVVVAKPKKKEKQDAWRQAATLKTTDDEDELKLSDPVERPKVDYSISPEYGLEEVQRDLLAPAVEPELVVTGGREQASEMPTEPRPSQAPRESQPKQSRAEFKPKAKKPSTKSVAVNNSSDAAPTKPVKLKQLLGFNFFGDIDLLLRTAVCIVFLGLAYTMEESVWNTWYADSGLNGDEKFVRVFPALIGSFICFVLFCWFVSVTFSVVMRSVANGNEKVDEWVGFAPSEWMGSFLIFAVSSWVAILPGALLGYVAMKITGWFVLLPLFGTLSFCVLLPVVLISAFVNESVYNVLSQDVLQSLSKDGDSWISAYQLSLVPGGIFLFGMLLVFLPGLFFSMLGAILQVLGITLYAILIGLQARVVISRMA